MVAHGKPLMALLRGDHQLSAVKIAGQTGDPAVRPAHPEEVERWVGAPVGFVGPVGCGSIPVLADQALAGRRNMICGANAADTHLRNVTPGRDFDAPYADLREAEDGDLDVESRKPVRKRKAIEVGHIFKLGYKYSESMGLRVLDERGRSVTPIMGSYGIGVERILTCAVEQSHDDRGMALPVSIAPFHAIVTPVNIKNAVQRSAAEQVYSEMTADGVDVLLDDRPERAGVKFKDADLIGVPFRVTLGRGAKDGYAEITTRRTGASENVTIEGVAAAVGRMIRDSTPGARD